jgi:hypothetical protein
MPQMNEETLNLELNRMTDDATGNNSTFIKENEYLLDRYLGNEYGDEQPERSKVISNDVMDVVEADMPSLARVFLGPGEILKFRPNKKSNEADRTEAESKTKYVNWQVREQPWSFTVLHGFIKNALIEKTSVVKYFIEENTEVEEHKKTGLSDDELAIFQDSLDGEDVKSVEVVREEQGDTEENAVVIRVEKTRKEVKILGVELEDFRMTKNATSKDTAELVGDVSLMTRGSLVAMGFKRDLVDQLPLASKQNDGSRLQEIRDADEGGSDDDTKSEAWASEEVKIEDLYPLVDYDKDGIAERRHIMRGTDGTILVNEVFNHVPYAVMSSIIMPHKAIGMSRAEITAPTARIKTAILRGVNDNIYAVNNPRIGANENVHMDDLLVMRPNGIVRSKGETNPGQNLFPIEIPYIGTQALQVLQYWDQARAQTTGTLLASQGLDADNLGEETATRFEGVERAAEAKIELVARVMAETGFRQLFEGVAWLDANFQNAETEIEILGEELAVDPSDWKFNHYVVSKVGLGAGDDEKILATLTALWSLHGQLQANNSPMTDEVKRYNVLKGMVTASGLPEIAEFFNDPEKPEELTLAQNEILTGLVEQLQGQVQQMQNPLAEAETIKQQGNLIKAQSDASIQVAKLKEEQRQFNIETKQEQNKMIQNQDQFMKDLAFQITELQAKVEGKAVDVTADTIGEQ